MSFVAVAIGGSALIGAGASMYAGSKAAGAQKGAAAQNAALQREQNAEAQRQYDLTRQDLAPAREVGTGALYKLSDLMGINRGATSGTSSPSTPDYAAYVRANPDLVADFNKVAGKYGNDAAAYGEYHWNRYGQFEPGRSLPTSGGETTTPQDYDTGVSGDDFGSFDRSFTLADFEKDPGYDFRRSEGQKGVENSASARGGVLSGGALKALARYNQDFASNEYGAAYNRYNNDITQRFNRLSALAGTGQQATSQQIDAGNTLTGQMQQGVNNITSANNAAGNARASQYAGTGQAIGNAANQVGQYFALKDFYRAPGVVGAGTGTPINLNGL